MHYIIRYYDNGVFQITTNLTYSLIKAVSGCRRYNISVTAVNMLGPSHTIWASYLACELNSIVLALK